MTSSPHRAAASLVAALALSMGAAPLLYCCAGEGDGGTSEDALDAPSAAAHADAQGRGIVPEVAVPDIADLEEVHEPSDLEEPTAAELSPDAPEGPEDADAVGDGQGAGRASPCPAGSKVAAEPVPAYCAFGCPEGWSRAEGGRCSPDCPEGWLVQGGACAPPCPEGMEAIGVLCRIPESEVGPQPCAAGGTFDVSGSEGSDLVVYVDQAGGDDDLGAGTAGAPFASLDAAFEAIGEAPGEVSVLLGPGTYGLEGGGPILLTSPLVGGVAANATTVRLLGACASTTLLSSQEDYALRISRTDLEVEVARLGFAAGGLFADQAGSVHLHDLHFVDGPAAKDGVDVSGLLQPVPTIVERCHFEGSELGVHAAFLVDIAVHRSRFSGQSKTAVSFGFYSGTASLDGCWFEGAESTALSLSPDPLSPATIQRSWFDGGHSVAIALEDADSAVLVEDCSVRTSALTAVAVSGGSGSTLAGLRIAGLADDPGSGERNGVRIFGGGALLEDLVIAGLRDRGVWLSEGATASLEGAWIADTSDAAIRVNSKAEALSLLESTLVGTHVGIEALGGVVELAGLRVARAGVHGVRAQEVDRFVLEQGVISGSGSVGLQLSVLKGPSGAEFRVQDSLLHEAAGAGLLLRSGGEHELMVLDNLIEGTQPGTVADPGGAFTVGDGVVVLTGTDAAGSAASLVGNQVGGSYRAGILAHGAGTSLAAEATAFGPGNGYGWGVDGAPVSSTDLLYQAGALLEGPDLAKGVLPVEALPVLDDPGGNPFLSGPGDPRLSGPGDPREDEDP